MVKKHWKLFGLISVVGLMLCIGCNGTVVSKQTAEEEKKVSIAEVPEAVKSTILAEAKGGTIGEIEMENEDGQTVYEAEAVVNGQEVDIKVGADGTLLSKEVENVDDDADDDDADEDDDDDEDADHDDDDDEEDDDDDDHDD